MHYVYTTVCMDIFTVVFCLCSSTRKVNGESRVFDESYSSGELLQCIAMVISYSASEYSYTNILYVACYSINGGCLLPLFLLTAQ